MAPPRAYDFVVDTTRRILAAVESAGRPPGAARFPLRPGARIAVAHDSGGIGKAIAARLTRLGFSVTPLAPGSLSGTQPPSAMPGDLAGLVLISNAQPISMPSDFEVNLELLRNAFRLARAAAPTLQAAVGGGLFVTVSRLDGAFGLAGASTDPAAGALAGLSKTAAHEWPGVRCRALDVDSGWRDSDAIADAIMEELCRAEAPVEVGLRANARYVPHLYAPDAEPKPRAVSDDGARSSPFAPGDIVVITGGARGVTAECALALAECVQPRLILVGRSELSPEPGWLQGLADPGAIKRALLANAFPQGAAPTPRMVQRAFDQVLAQREVTANLERIRATGAEVHYRSADVRNAAHVELLLQEVRHSLGPIRGIIHAAGVIADARIEKKSDEQFDAVIETKLLGLQNLVRATAADDLRLFAMFSSVSARYGREGQCDYAMANEVLNKAAHWLGHHRPHCRIVSIGWGPWAGGMVNGALKREFAKIGVGLVPLREGAEQFVREITAAETEVLIGGVFDGAASRSGSSPGAAASIVRGPDSLPDRPYLAAEFTASADDPRLRDHVIGGRAVAPVALLIEWMTSALHDDRAFSGLTFQGLRDLHVFRPCAFNQPHRTIRIHRGPLRWQDGIAHCSVSIESAAADGVFASKAAAILRFCARLPHNTLQFAATTSQTRSDSFTARDLYGPMLFHGPAWQAISHLQKVSEDRLVAKIVEHAQSPASLIDAALQIGLVYAHAFCDSASLPGAVAAFDVLTPDWVNRCRAMAFHVKHRSGHRIRGSVQLLDESDCVVAALNGVEWTMDRSLRTALVPNEATA